MYLKGSAKLSTALARELVEKGFRYEDIKKIIIDNTPYRDDEVKVFEDVLFNKIEKFSQYLQVIDTETGEDYYYFTARDLHEDTGLTLGVINGSIYSGYLANSVFKIQKLAFSSNELCKDKTQIFNKRLGKIKTRESYTKNGKYVSNPLIVIDTHTDDIKVYGRGRVFCEEFNLEAKDLAKYIINGWKFMNRYKIESCNKTQ